MSLSKRDRVALGVGLAGAICALAGAWLVLVGMLGAHAPGPDPGGLASPSASADASADGSALPSADVVVDVQGAVRHPGIVLLPAGSRVADALSAAGGYSGKADLNAAAAALNLAAVLSDGAQVYVPIIGAATGGGGGPAPSSGNGLVNLNTASPEELEALPGIGPVTVQKIVAARAEKPFATLDEMVEREVIDRGQLEDIRALVTF